MEQRITEYMARYRMIAPGERVVVGVSGGADSVCLLFALLAIRKEPHLLHVVHVNHGIRQEAGEDADFVARICAGQGVPFTLVEEDVPALAGAEKCSEEEMGRKVRYRAFERVCREIGASKIAVAHNSDDQAETMLFHLFRGSGLTGLCGIRPVRDHIIRPILCLTRREVEEYLRCRGIAYCTDATNASDDYTRNRIRHHIMPQAEDVAAGAAEHMSRTAELLLETEELLERMTEAAGQQVVRERAEKKPGAQDEPGARDEADAQMLSLDVEAFLQLEPVIGKRLILSLLKEFQARDMEAVHVEAVRELFWREGNREIALPGDVIAARVYGKVRIGRHRAQEEGAFRHTIAADDLERESLTVPLPDGQSLIFSLLCGKNCEDIPENRYTKWLDYDKIKQVLVLRFREKGDRISIRSGAGGISHKSVQDFMVNEKIPKAERDSVPILAEGNSVLWMVGYRIGEYYKVSENTKRILQVQLKKDSQK